MKGTSTLDLYTIWIVDLENLGQSFFTKIYQANFALKKYHSLWSSVSDRYVFNYLQQSSTAQTNKHVTN